MALIFLVLLRDTNKRYEFPSRVSLTGLLYATYLQSLPSYAAPLFVSFHEGFLRVVSLKKPS